ncbi:zinc metallopeptidase [Xiamenia xianingshaonis]|uniref:Peptidase n=1 Tax=Xiamenia xianingshaonis TaxID=2682776 RepID=A0A9E6MSR6_9ACTN|nr:zinc metallopeptidase [Xiamenia xianingshaonis]NGM16661.1 peptidase [Eggerthellaceae bacterium zg-893]NHM13664.1 peptidase [Xiamenia xianingshaonis]NHM15592.1 peptidase [Xiamenia xianingshaonis]QTU85036.1 zinc metallopeptidase [Xiamenia xianingshaonis]
MFGLSSSYLMLIVVTLLIGCGATWYVRSQLKKYENVPNSSGRTGAEIARGMLAYYGIQGVEVRPGGPDQDFFDPRTNSVTLSPEAYGGRSITAAATACHEVGHACQYAADYTPMRVRTAIVPVVNLASNAWMFILLIGIMLNIAGFIDLAIILYAFAVVFQIVTLPVEFNASRRAMAYMEATGIPAQEQAGSFSVLRACALTYVAAALTSILQLLWLLGQRRD